MGNKKRGKGVLLMVVLVGVLLIIGSLAVSEEEEEGLGDEGVVGAKWEQPIEDVWEWEDNLDNDYVWLVGVMKTGGDASTGGKVRFSDTVARPDDFCEGKAGNVFVDIGWGVILPGHFVGYCGIVPCCILQLVHYDYGAYDECSGAFVSGGAIISSLYEQEVEYLDVDWLENDGGYHPDTLKGHSDVWPNTFICDGNIWKECSGGTEGSFLDVSIYNPEDEGADELGFIHIPYFCVAKVYEEEVTYDWVTVPDPSADKDEDGVPVVFDCDDDDPDVFGNFTAYGGPEPRVICGDGKDYNTCGAIVNEQDDCDHESNQDACENNCLTGDGRCNWLIGADGENRCCGDDTVVKELGSIGTSISGNFICLSNEEGLVGAEGEEIVGWNEELCGEEWCWISASGEAAFDVFTIRMEKEPDYDVVSNGWNWFKCEEEGPILDDPYWDEEEEDPGELYKRTHRFYCYQEGDRWSWAECTSDAANRENEGVKGRWKGEGLYSLPLRKEEGGTGEEKSGQVIGISSGYYSDFYGGDTSFRFDGYKYLNFMVKFCDKEEEQGECNDVSKEELFLPANVFLEIKGEEETYFNKAVLGYTVNGPFFGKNWMHVKVPISELDGKPIKTILIRAEQSNNYIKVRNVYLSKEEEPLLCSGEDTIESGETSWLDDIDQGDPDQEITGEELCNTLYDPENKHAWLGDDNEVDGEEANCCGNEEEEYYAEKSKIQDDEKRYGCWNSQVIGSMATIMNVEFEVQQGDLSEKFTYACSGEECLYPLPGVLRLDQSYRIKNTHPELYELYFVEGSQPEDEVLIDQTREFSGLANLRVKKVAQQVMFINEEDEETGEVERGFFGCEAASYAAEYVDENLEHCLVKGDKFCAYQDSYEKEYALINSWSKEPLTEWGYQEITGEEYTEEMEFLLIEDGTPKPATERNWSSNVVPGRNFLTNAEFSSFDGEDLIGWEVIEDGVHKIDERGYMRDHKEDEILILPGNHKLKSERIAVPKGKDILFTMEGDCEPTINFYDKDGNQVETNPFPIDGGTNYFSGDASYLIMMFNGFCEIKQPMLQVVDELGIADYSYKTEYPERSGAACCPENWCWNGYACAGEMSKLSYMSEHISEGRDYRCIEGEWNYLPLRWDWNYDKFGFCSTEEQCFVVSEGTGEAPEEFYEGNFPSCVNNTEFIFDHYCDKGNWTSRTKFLASKLIKFAETKEFILYCTNYKDVLLDYGEERYLGGDIPVVIEEEVGLGEAIAGEAGAEQGRSCFSTLLGETGKKLVPEKENTCINNICVLRFKEWGKFKSAFAVTLNKEINDSEDSFLKALNVPRDVLDMVCAGEGGLIECDLSDLDLSGLEDGDLWYSSDLKAVIYGKEGIGLEPGFLGGVWNKVKELFSGLFGEELGEAGFSKFVEEATNFNELYLLNKDGKTVKAMQEVFPEKKTLVAEYGNFETSLCDYTANIKVPPDVEVQLLESETGVTKTDCIIEGSKQKFMAIAGLDFFWPQLTGKLRARE